MFFLSNAITTLEMKATGRYYQPYCSTNFDYWFSNVEERVKVDELDVKLSRIFEKKYFRASGLLPTPATLQGYTPPFMGLVSMRIHFAAFRLANIQLPNLRIGNSHRVNFGGRRNPMFQGSKHFA